MRNLVTVINEMLAEIPEEEETIRAQLEDNRESATYAAPENIGVWWNEVYRTIWK